MPQGDGATFKEVEQDLTPFAQMRKFTPCSYALQFSLRAPPPTSRFGSTGNFGGMGSLKSATSLSDGECAPPAPAKTMYLP